VIASQETKPIVTIENKSPRLLDPPPMSRTQNVNFANQIQLLGYDLPVRILGQGQGVPVTLYWRGLRTMDKSYTVFVKLLDDQKVVWGSTDRFPADGHRTIYWLENEVVVDGFELPVDANIPDGIYWFNVGLYEEIDGAAVSLPLVVNNTETEVTSATFGPVKFGNLSPDVVATQVSPDQPVDVTFGQVIQLIGYDKPLLESGQLRLKLFWKSVAPTGTNFTTFVHLRNQNGQIVAQMDGPPAAGIYPTSIWSPTEIIPDTVLVPLPESLPSGSYTIVVGLYDFNTGMRLPVANSPDDGLLLTEITLE
jgi:hypothetical protein